MIVLCLATALGLTSCEDEAARDVGSVKIDGKWFHLELALDDKTRFQGLSGREHIEADGGMLFVFPDSRPRNFVMRDCPVPIDIIYLDATGRVVAMHQMTPEPRKEDEGEAGQYNAAYEDRLTRYPSRYAAQFVIELTGKTLDSLKVEEGDKIELDGAELKRRAR